MEVDVQFPIFLFGIGHAADDQHGDVRGEFAEATNELRSIHAWHEVVCDDHVDGSGIFSVTKLLESMLWAENCDDEVACTFEDRLTGGGLDGVVVDEK